MDRFGRELGIALKAGEDRHVRSAAAMLAGPPAEDLLALAGCAGSDKSNSDK
ncbi:hypothetical protein ACFXPS_07020 [Nocardia sp. NPDC059091]|uniref:hypothetical protein n=1 Tax=unclassified Nocardia TaxID=2637762 RepID=UPI00368775FE